MEPYNACLTTASVLLNSVCRCLCLIDQVGIEDIKFISLYNLGRWVVVIIVGLVIFVPFISSVNPVEVLWFSWAVLVMPPICLRPNRFIRKPYKNDFKLKNKTNGKV